MSLQTPHVHRAQPGDDINQVLRAVKSAQGSLFCLVLPTDSPMLRNDVNVRLLVAYAREAGCQLALVTTDPLTVQRAAAYGIPSYANPEDAADPGVEPIDPQSQVDLGSQAEPNAPMRKRRSGRLATVAILCLGILLSAFAVWPRVKIQIVSELTWLEWTEVLASDRLPSRQRVFMAAGFGEVATTGSTRIGSEYARGVVVLFNEGASAVTIPQGTVVSTQSGVAYQTESPVTVPAREVVYFLDAPVGVSAGRAEVRVRAVHPGEEGNVSEGRIRAIEGFDVSVRNPEPLTGGSDRLLPAVTEGDVVEAHSKARADFDRRAKELLAEAAAEEETFILVHYEVSPEMQVDIAGAPGQPGEAVQVRLEAELHSYWVDRTEMYAIMSETIAERLPMGYTWEQARGFDVTVVTYDPVGTATHVRVGVPLDPQLDPARLAGGVAGLTPNEATERLLALPGIAEVRVSRPELPRLPQWAPWIAIDLQPVSRGPDVVER